MAQYVSRYIAEYATITSPLQALTKKETPWQWSDEQQHVLDKLKDSLTKSHFMSYFNPAVTVDASPVGLGGSLVQDGKVISYAGRALSETKRYQSSDTVLVRQPKKNKLSTPFNPEPLVVEGKKGPMVTASDGFKTITRSSSMFKIIPKNLKVEGDRREQDDFHAEDFPAEQAEVLTQDEDPKHQVRTTAACRGHRDKGDPQRGSQITFK